VALLAKADDWHAQGVVVVDATITQLLHLFHIPDLCHHRLLYNHRSNFTTATAEVFLFYVHH
jgi:hypothetical protein